MPLLTLYRLLTIGLTPFAGGVLAWRARRGREDPARLMERVGVASAKRPEGRLVWLHGASIGESLALLPLIDRFIQRGVDVLVTTGTVTSAKVVKARLPAGATHQYLPLDAPRFVERFLGHWRPDIVLFAESELWPNMIRAVHARRLPLILVNAAISRRSAERWRRLPGGPGRLLGKIDLCLAQNAESAARYLGLGAPRVRVCGNLKFDVPPPPAGPARLAAFTGAIGARPVWAAVSTHEGEERIAIEAHLALCRDVPDLLTIIAPRQPERGGEIAALARAAGLETAQRTLDGEPRRATAIYVADTVGELGLILRAAGVVFMGKSLTAAGGHSPIEPAKLGCAVLHGPHVENFADIYAELATARAAARVTDAESLSRALSYLLAEPSRMRKMGRAGGDVVTRLGGASQSIMAAVEPYLAQSALEQK
ncbi:3-deoxy-D-manno-octulosonic acid transferase [Methylosinus sp. Sm6]|uniref:3-deoxy-D-manno-octulosonic acid transferase n=1 Tax=Methylosinus sp. Sm6 TaxID=2866948 RepID=UPI001C995C68|nr:3-deoxy-D-manno-octulosonic acid transferase [Methylosinus sp. Sm6]MBY6243325.1 3-deoxy-D-manno-octulosonic acid transferase [Methylosinus sp. Sm6]